MFTHEACGAVVVYDELKGFVEPSVCAVAVPVGVGAFFEGYGGCGVEADDERGGFDFFEGGGIVAACGEEVFSGFDALVSWESG